MRPSGSSRIEGCEGGRRGACLCTALALLVAGCGTPPATWWDSGAQRTPALAAHPVPPPPLTPSASHPPAAEDNPPRPIAALALELPVETRGVRLHVALTLLHV